MEYVVVDLEMCRIPDTHANQSLRGHLEIMQIGAVLLNEKYHEISTFSVFVRPVLARVDDFIEKLTGIRERDLKDAPSLKEAIEMMSGWIGERQVTFLAWSKSDYTQFKKEFNAKGINGPFALRLLDKKNWRDIQKEFKKHFSLSRDYSLSDAMALMRIEFEGQAHNGLVDAINTGRLACKLVNEPSYELPEVYRAAISNAKPVRLMYTVSDLFEGINLDTLIEVSA